MVYNVNFWCGTSNICGVIARNMVNGLPDEMLPKVIKQTPAKPQVFMWHSWQGTPFLKVGLSEVLPAFEECYFMDAAYIPQTLNYN